MAKKKAKRSAKKKPARKPKPDETQQAVSAIERVIGGKLKNRRD